VGHDKHEGYTVRPPTLRFWNDSERLVLTSFTVSDFVEFNMEPDGLNGVQAKEFVRDGEGTAWLLKSGALGDSDTARPSPREERSRRAAFPVHEAIVALLLQSVGVCVSDVDLAFRTLQPVGEPEPLRLLVSVHRLVHGRRRDKAGDFQPSAAFSEDLFVTLCMNIVVGQRDHQLHNYLVDSHDRFVVIDNSACMYDDWLTNELTSRHFDDVSSLEPLDRGWPAALMERVQRRFEPLTEAVVNTAFTAVPTEAVAWHDAAAGIGYYAPGTIAQKQARVGKNVKALRRWAGLDSV
jgi:hypothetical protein